jgi:sugar lactone lactonase YvrE
MLPLSRLRIALTRLLPRRQPTLTRHHPRLRLEALEERELLAGITTFAGNGTTGFSGDGGPATSAALNGPFGGAIDSSGNLYFCDQANQRIRKVTPQGIISTVAGNGTAGFSGDGGPATSAALNGPNGVAVDANGNLFIADQLNRRIRKVTPGGIISTFAGNGTSGFSGDGGPATKAALASPSGEAVDASGNLFFADLGNQRIREVTPQGVISTVAGMGTAGFSGDGGLATRATLNAPIGVAVDGVGDLFIIDLGNQRIRKVTPQGIISTVAGNGTMGFSGDGGPATSAALNTPSGVAVDAGANLYIADSGNQRIRKVTPGGIISTFAGNGTQGFSGDGGPATNAALNGPNGVVFDASGRLFFADRGNQRIRVLGPSIRSNGGDGQTAPVGTAVGIPPSVLVLDISDIPRAGVAVTFAVATGGGMVTGASVVSNAAGLAIVGSWTLGTTPGTNTLTATAAGIAGSVSFTATAVPGAAARLAFATQPSDVVPGRQITPAVSVLVEDSFGNIVTTDNSLVTLTLANNPGGATLGGFTAGRAVNGRVPFNALFLTATGSGYTLTASDGSLQPITSQPFNVKPVVLTASSATVLDGQPVTFTFQAFSLAPFQGNPFGQATFSLGSTVLGTVPVNSDGLATFTTVLQPAPGGGPNTVTACYNDPITDSTAVTVVAVSGAGVPVTVVLGPGDSGTLATLADGAPAGTRVGTLQTNSPLVGQFVPASYSLPPNFGDDNLFSITPGSSPSTMNLVANFTAAFASRRSYTVQVVSDIGTGPVSAVFTIFVAPPASTSPARTTTTLTSSLNPVPTVGQAVTFTALVRASGGTPTGNVLFVADGASLGSVLLVNGSAVLTVSTFAMGNHPVAATYVSDGTFVGSTSSTLTQTVGPAHPGFNVGVYDPVSSTFYLHNDKNSGPADAGSFVYGLQDWKPVTGDFTGGKKTTIGIVDPSGFRDTVNHRDAFWFLGSANGKNDIAGFAYGFASWTPIAGDWTGSGKYGIGAYDPATATFYLRNETSGGAPDAGAFQFGAPGWIPLAGDWTGSGKFGIGVFDPTTATFYLRNELSGGAPDAGVIQFGLPFWKPVVGDWNGDGKWTIGVVDPSGARDTVNHRDAYWFLSDDNKTVTYTPFAYGFAAWTPLGGVWNPAGGGSKMAATGVAAGSAGPLLDAWAVARLARAEKRSGSAEEPPGAADRASVAPPRAEQAAGPEFSFRDNAVLSAKGG